jgi:hypothetical protein
VLADHVAMWCVPTLQELRCLLAFIVLTAVSFLVGYTLIMERGPDHKAERMQSSILLYGSAQSLIGFLGGFYLSKLVHTLPPTNPFMTGGYGHVKSEDEFAEV